MGTASSDLLAQTQVEYAESAYQDSSWEVVGELVTSADFTPMEIGVLQSGGNIVDPMFADFGGKSVQKGPQRWHLPDHLAYQSEEQRLAQAEAQEERESMTKTELEALIRRAHEEGCAQGRTEAQADQDRRLGEMQKRLTTLLQDLQKQIDERLSLTETQAVQLAVDIAHKIIENAVEINPEYIVGIINKCLKLAGGAAIRKVRVSPQDMEFIEVIGVAKHIKEYDGSWQFEADDTIRSGCVIDTSAGEIDYQLDSAWERVKENVVKVIK